MSDISIEVINLQTNDDLTGLVIDGTPHLFWLAAYKALGLTPQHARRIILTLEEGKHYRAFSKLEIDEIKATINVTFISHVSHAYFLTEEGMNRAIMEIETSRMGNKVAAEKINELKNQMASIFTRYQRGEVLHKSKNEIPVLPGDIIRADYAPVAAVLEDQMAIARVMIGEGVEPAVAKSMAFSVTEEITHCGDTLTPWRNLIQADPFISEPALLTPTDLGKDLGGLSAVSMNKILVKLGYQKRIGKEWVPTQIGKIYARFVPQEIKHNRGIVRHMQLKWIPAIVEKVREKMFYENKGQTGLFTGEMGI